MKDRAKATLAALATMAVVAAAMALPALAQTGVDEPWSNTMNQTSYWESRFGGECDKTENHSGYVGEVSQAVVKDGNRVRVYNPSPTQVLGPVNPANGKHFDPPHSWVMTCTQTSSTSSTSTSSTSSTTSTSVVTTTTQPTTTTTTPEETTTTTEAGTTTTTTGDSSTTSTAPSTSSSTELPLTGASTDQAIVLAIFSGLLGLMILYLVKTQP